MSEKIRPSSQREKRSQKEVEKARKTAAKGRMRFLGLGIGAALLATVGLCSIQINKGSSTSSDAQESAETAKFYPEIKEKRLKSSGNFSTDAFDIGWFNYSDLQFDQQKATELIKYYEQLAQPQPQFLYSVGNEQTVFRIRQNPLKHKRIFLISPSDPLPSWAHPEVSELGQTKGFIQYDSMASFVKVYPPKSLNTPDYQTGIEPIFSTEACQATIQVGYNGNRWADLAQEIFCNTQGSVITAHSFGNSYQEYLNFAGKGTIGTPNSLEKYPLLKLSSLQYDATPNIKGVIR